MLFLKKENINRLLALAQKCESISALIVSMCIDSEIGRHVLQWLCIAFVFLCKEGDFIIFLHFFTHAQM